jgi:ELWxxDGT repeat protein
MWFRSVRNALKSPPSASAARRKQRRPLASRLHVEALEDRTLLSATLVQDINPATAGSWPESLTAVGDRVFFTAEVPATGRELYVSDGTPAGTRLVKDIRPGSGGSIPISPGPHLTNVNGTLFFLANDGVHGDELWKSDGTAEGTILVKDILPGPASPFTGDSTELTEVSGTLFFLANDGVHGRELWKSDGTEAGTVLVEDINPGSASSTPYGLTAVGDRLFFSAQTLATGRELWVSDGTAEGTVPVPGTGGFYPGDLINVGGTLFFSTSFFFGEAELWKSDGTAAGTVPVASFYPTFSADGSSCSYSVGRLANVNGTLFFQVAEECRYGDNDNGYTFTFAWSLYRTDGTSAGTVFLGTFAGSRIDDLTVVGGTLFFVSGGFLWKCDGTAGGTSSVHSERPYWLTSLGDRLFFSAFASGTGQELWVSGGPSAGTRLVTDINPGAASSGPQWLTAVGGRLFFGADDGVHGRELWVLAPERVESVTINDGSAQRSRVTSLTVTFSGGVSFDPGAFELLRQDGSPVGLEIVTSLAEGRTVAVLTFAGDDILGGSLADGNYTLTIRGERIHDALGWSLDGDGDGTPGVDRVDSFFRLYGDSDGDRNVDLLDVVAFFGTFGRTAEDPAFLWYFDFDGDGAVDTTDLLAFAGRYGMQLNP